MRLFFDIARAYPKRTAVMIVCMIVGLSAEVLSLSALLPLVTVMIGPDRRGGDPSGFQAATQSVLDWLGIDAELGDLLILFVVASSLQSSLLFLAKRQIGFTASLMATDLRLQLLRALAGARWSYFSAQSIGSVSASVSSEAGRASGAYLAGATVVSLSVQAAVYAVLAFAVSWQFSLVALIATALSLYPVRFFIALSRKAGDKQTEVSRSLGRQLTQSLQAVKPLKAMSRESRLGGLLERDARRLDRARRKQVLAFEGRKAVQFPLNAIFAAAAIYAAATYGDVSVAELGVLAVLLTNTLSNVNKAQRQYQTLSSEESAYWALRERIDRAEEAREEPSGSLPPKLERGIVISDVDFSYGDKRVLHRASLTIAAGQITALIGTSGAGKTSLVDLVCALNRQDSGSILVDGTPLHELDLVAWRRGIGYVPQDMFLLHESIRLNVTLGEEFSDEEVITALQRAGAWEFVSEMPDGMHTVVGEGGSRISGGQRQRISIARALVHCPHLLILDEATSGLDPDTEATVWNSLLRLGGDLTILAISHQPRLMAVADHVYRVEAGEISLDQRHSAPAGAHPA